MIYRILSSFVLAAILSSCDNSSSSSKNPNIDVIGTKNANSPRASCDYNFDEGGRSPLSLPSAQVKSSRFFKKYNSSLIAAVSEASGAETARFAGLAGVTFYKANDLDMDDKDCLFTGSLPDAPSPILKYFRDAESDVKSEGDGKSTLLGFYLDKESVQSIVGNSKTGPVITVKNDVDRYTMVHEFFHHVFSLSKDVSGTLVQMQFRKSNKAFSDSADAYNAEESASNLENLARAFDVQAKDMVKVLKEYTLEEMTIEFELNDLYQTNSLKYVNKFSRLNGDYYSVSSAESALERIEKNEKVLEAIASEAQKKNTAGENVNATVNILSGTRSMFINLKNEINAVAQLAQTRIDKYKNSHSNIAHSVELKLSASKKSGSKKCSHSHDVDKFLDAIESRMGKIKLGHVD